MASRSTSGPGTWRHAPHGAIHDEPPWLIDNLAALNAWRRRLREFTASDELPAVQLRLDRLSEADNHTFTILANELRDACGCATGGLFMGTAVIVSVAGYFITGHQASGIGPAHLGTLLGIVIAAALGGKLLGLLIARWRLIRLADHVRRCTVGAST